jgi:hypothetical protein
MESPGLEALYLSIPSNLEQTDTPDFCPTPKIRAGYRLVNSDTGETRAGYRCGRNTCCYCVGVNASRRSLAQSWALLHSGTIVRHGTLTWVAPAGTPLEDVWRVSQRSINMFFSYARRAGIDLGEWSYTIEHNPKDTGYHAHYLQFGPKRLDFNRLNELTAMAGMGRTSGGSQVRNIDKAAAYNLKGATYNLKGFDEERRMAALVMNGKRLEHHTRSFFPTATVHEAETLSLSEFMGDTSSSWGWHRA